MIIIEYLLLTFPTLVHLVVDYKGKVRHKLNAVYVTVLSVAVGLSLPGYWWQGALYALSLHFSLFDPLYNITHQKPLFYHGSSKNPDQALTDKAWMMLSGIPLAEVFIRIFIIGVAGGVYYHLDQII